MSKCVQDYSPRVSYYQILGQVGGETSGNINIFDGTFVNELYRSRVTIREKPYLSILGK